MQKKINSKYILKIPKKLNIFFNKKTNIIIFTNGLTMKAIKLKLNVDVNTQNKTLKFYSKSNIPIPNNEKRKLKAIRGTTIALLKQVILELTIPFCKKMRFVGVGYRALELQKNEKTAFFVKLGLSHPLYLSSGNETFKLFCLKFTRLYLFGTSYALVSQAAATIRSFKVPEPYKGKGIRYVDETIHLKQGKKI